jgi:micrococcal nuclease
MFSSFSSRSHRQCGRIIIAGLGLTALLAADGGAQRRRFSHEPSANCQLQQGGESTVLAVAGPQTLRLADGRFVRLAEVLVPAQASTGSAFDPSSAATAYLRAGTLGKKVEVRFGGTQRDRYGVYVAHIFVAGDPPVWIQEALVSSGLAQAFPQIDNHACAARLMSAEAIAREAKRGHWGIALFKVLRASDPRSITKLVQTYQVVEGKVDHAFESGGRLTLHFGAEGKYGFAAILEPAAKKRFADKQGPEDWDGLSLRMRGWIDRKRGPTISITQPEQIEILSQDANESAQIKKAQ